MNHNTSDLVWQRVRPAPGSAIECSHCGSVALRVLANGTLLVTHRHHGQYHQTAVNLKDLLEMLPPDGGY